MVTFYCKYTYILKKLPLEIIYANYLVCKLAHKLCMAESDATERIG